MRYLVELAPWSLAPWFSQVFAGLFDLQARGVVRVQLVGGIGDARWLDRFTLPMRVTEVGSGKRVFVAIDLNDTSKFSLKSGLEAAQIIFKRSYRRDLLEEHSPGLVERTIPFGINYNCFSRNVPTWRLLRYHYGMRVRSIGKGREISGAAWRLHHLRFMLAALPNNTSISEREFRWRPDAPSAAGVFFITRLHKSRVDCQEMEHLTTQRVELVARLRQAFGRRFVGGVVRDALSEKRCPKSLLITKVSRREFIAMLRNTDIFVSTLGVGQSTPWKLGEALASSRCVLTEPLHFDLPQPLVEDIHLRVFRGVEDCVEKASALLEKPEFVGEIKRSAWDYYQKNVRAEALVEQVLNRACAAEVS